MVLFVQLTGMPDDAATLDGLLSSFRLAGSSSTVPSVPAPAPTTAVPTPAPTTPSPCADDLRRHHRRSTRCSSSSCWISSV